MKINIFTVIVGNAVCNAECPYCVSRMTPNCGVGTKPIEPNFRNFEIACCFAKNSNVSTVLLTGKGEPTLFSNLVSQYVRRIHEHGFPFIELQTNGILLSENKSNFLSKVEKWYLDGLTTVSISIVHYDEKRNAEIFRPGKPYYFWHLVDCLHQIGLSVRITCTLVKGYIDNVDDISRLANVCQLKDVEQLTVREVSRPDNKQDIKTTNYVDEHNTVGLCNQMQTVLQKHFAKLLLKLPHGGLVYDWNGQNICLANCLTDSTDQNDIRQLIFFPDGHLRYDWRYPGAIIL